MTISFFIIGVNAWDEYEHFEDYGQSNDKYHHHRGAQSWSFWFSGKFKKCGI